jgi:hypothetical protein
MIGKKFALFRLRYNRGHTHLGLLINLLQLTTYISIIIIFVDTYFGMTLPAEMIFLVPLLPFCLYLIGWYDEKRGCWKEEQSYYTRNINPYYRKLEKNVEEIKVMLGDKGKQDIRTDGDG